MRFSLSSADLWIPDGTEPTAALARTTHLAVGAHQDDLEILAYHGIAACHRRPDRWFLGVVATDGGGSARSGAYAQYTDAEMRAVRRQEQRRAAELGGFGACVQLDHPSAVLKDPGDPRPVADLAGLLRAARPEVVYTHNLADKHDTHVAVALRTLAALRGLPPEHRPHRVYGCEVWRDLDWLPDADKVALDVSGEEDLQAALLEVFASQVAGGKRYDLATLGRRRAHATYHESHGTDASTGLTFAMDLTPLVADPGLDPSRYAEARIERLREDVLQRLARLGG